jgi:hypothetical protein
MTATAPTATIRPHAAAFHKASCREWVEALRFRYGDPAVRRAFAGLPAARPTDKPLQAKMDALVNHFGATRIRSILEPEPTFTCACPGGGPGGLRINVGPADLAGRLCLTCRAPYKAVA